MANSFTDQLRQTVKDQITNPESLARRALQQAIAAGVPITQLPQKFREYGYDPQTGRIIPQSPIYAENRDMSDPNNQLAVGMMIGAAEPTGGNAAILKAQLNRKMDPGYDLKPPASMSQTKFRPIDEVAPEPDIKKIQLDTTTPEGNILYHGTDANFDEMKVGQPTKRRMMLNEYDTTSHGMFFTPDEKVAGEYGKNVGQYRVNVKNPLDFRDKKNDAIFNEFDKLIANDPTIKDIKPGDPGFSEFMYFDGDIGKKFTDFIKSKGFDGAKLTETSEFTGDKFNTIVALDNAQVKKLNPEQLVRSGKVK